MKCLKKKNQKTSEKSIFKQKIFFKFLQIFKFNPLRLTNPEGLMVLVNKKNFKKKIEKNWKNTKFLSKKIYLFEKFFFQGNPQKNGDFVFREQVSAMVDAMAKSNEWDLAFCR